MVKTLFVRFYFVLLVGLHAEKACVLKAVTIFFNTVGKPFLLKRLFEESHHIDSKNEPKREGITLPRRKFVFLTGQNARPISISYFRFL